MAAPTPHSGEMSQDSQRAELHPTNVTAPVIDPAARQGKRIYNALSASSVGLELGLAVVIGLLAGYWLDQKLGTQPWMMLLWLVFGLIAGFRGVVRSIKRADIAAADETVAAPANGLLRKEVGRG
jgi:ATP synthase protein I